MEVEKTGQHILTFWLSTTNGKWAIWGNLLCKEFWSTNPWGWVAKKTLPRGKGQVPSTRTKAWVEKETNLWRNSCGWEAKVGSSTDHKFL